MSRNGRFVNRPYDVLRTLKPYGSIFIGKPTKTGLLSIKTKVLFLFFSQRVGLSMVLEYRLTRDCCGGKINKRLKI